MRQSSTSELERAVLDERQALPLGAAVPVSPDLTAWPLEADGPALPPLDIRPGLVPARVGGAPEIALKSRVAVSANAPPIALLREAPARVVVEPAMPLRAAGAATSVALHVVAVVAALLFVVPAAQAPVELPTIDVEIVEAAAAAPAAASAAAEPVAEELPQPTPPDPPVEHAMRQEPPPPDPASETAVVQPDPPPVVLDMPAVAEIPLPAELTPPPKPQETPPVTRPQPPQPRPVARTRPHVEPPQTRQPEPAPPRRSPARAATAPSTASSGRGVTSEGQRSATPPPSYIGLVMARLHRAKVYPPAERDRGQQGQAAVRFAITRAGGATGVALVRSSGNAALDQAAIAMVHRAAPFPPLPAEFGPSVMTLTAPVSFSLR